ncbi:hypothetical protein SDC9_203966 [bioreactor metagenome]|uniref:Uncharacterized protein n=1 Tax=bioreactor metagenome TaxID=1076179 RepID=A0A645IZE7_9ZZZZ
MKFIENTGTDVQTMLGGHLARQHLIDAPRGLVHHPFGGGNDLDPLQERWGLLDHVHGDVEHNGSLLPICGAAIHLSLPLAIVHQHIECNGCAQLGLALLLGYFDVRRGVLAHRGVVFPYRAKNIRDDLFLPREKLKVLPVKFAFCVLQTLDEINHTAGLTLIKRHCASPPSGASP